MNEMQQGKLLFFLPKFILKVYNGFQKPYMAA